MGSSVTLTGSQATAVAGLLGASLMMLYVFLLAFWILCIIARWKIFTKAGEAGWKSIIPIYADYVQWRIGWKKIGLFWVALALVIVGIVLSYMDGAFVTNAAGRVAYTGAGGMLSVIGSLMIIAGAIINLVSVYKLFASFGHGLGWLIGYIFVPNIMLLVLGFGSSQYLGPRD